MQIRTRAVRALSLVVLLAGCASGGMDAAAPDVTIKGFLFQPASVSVKAGATLTWKNADDIAHTVTAGVPAHPTGLFNSGDRTIGQTFAFTFTAAGTFDYFCNNHQSMHGSVQVT